MDQHVTAWAVASLVSGSLGWLAGLSLMFLNYGRIIGATAGVGLIGPFFIGLLSSLLCLLGLVFGLLALARTKTGHFRGRRPAWTGVVLGGLGLAAYVIVSGRYMFGWW